MELSTFFQPIDTSKLERFGNYTPRQLGSYIDYHTAKHVPDLKGADIAIMAVADDRRAARNEGCAHGADDVRGCLYRLYRADSKPSIADLGTIQQGHEVDDTYFAVQSVVSELLKANVLPVIIGGGQDITYANYLGYEALEKAVNIVSVDAALDIGLSLEE